MRDKTKESIKGLLDGTDLQRILERAGVTATGAVKLLEGQKGRRQMEARRALSLIHVELLAHRYAALAMIKLCGLLSEKKPELQLKGALAVLDAVRPGKNDDG